MRWFDRHFNLEEINGDGLCPTYLFRWTLLTVGKLFAVYLHKFVGDDWSIDLHDHPKRFISIGLRGQYVEIAPLDWEANPFYCSSRLFKAPWLRTFPAEHRHRLVGPTPQKPCWTLVIVTKRVRDWGFWPRGRFVPWRQYVEGPEAPSRKSCP